MARMILPQGWPRPKGYANAVLAQGQLLSIAGQIGWNEQQNIVSDDFIVQVRQALLNTRALLEAAQAKPEHLVRMTWYLTDKQQYLARLKELGQVYQDVIGKHYPAMTAVEVTALIEDRALVEIESAAVIPLQP